MGSSKSTSTHNPYAPSQPLFKQSADILKNYLNDPNSTAVYDGQRYIDPSQYTQQGIADLANNKGYDQARGYYSDVLSGKYLNDNPHTQQLQQAVQSAVMPGLNATFAKSGMMGSTLHQGSLARALTDGMAAPMFQNYQNERGYQNAAAGALPAMDSANAMAKLQAGQVSEGYTREKMMADWQKWKDQQDAPLLALGKAYPFISDIGKQGGTSTTTSSANPWQTAAGIGMAGLGLMSGGAGLGMGLGGLGFSNPFSGLMGGGLFGKQATNATDPFSYNMPWKG